jgi:uncharacterized membrane protein
MNLNAAHLHLLLNHFPTVGLLVVFGLFVGSVIYRHEDLKRTSFAMFFGLALISIPAFMTGSGAQQALQTRTDVSAAAIANHEDAAMWGFVLIEITGCMAWFALWQYRRSLRPVAWATPAILLCGVLSFVVMAKAAELGGDIRHPEIEAAPQIAALAQADAAPAPAPWWKAVSVAGFIKNVPWAWPASETIHFVGLCLLMGVVIVVNLRMVGIIKNVSFPSLHRLLPIGMLGFLINGFSGMMFFIGTPEQYVKNVAFYWKVALILIAGADVLYFTVFDEPWRVGANDEPPARTKFVAATTIVLWVGVMYFGRMLPYIGNSF